MDFFFVNPSHKFLGNISCNTRALDSPQQQGKLPKSQQLFLHGDLTSATFPALMASERLLDTVAAGRLLGAEVRGDHSGLDTGEGQTPPAHC